jgi:hypothetical protein
MEKRMKRLLKSRCYGFATLVVLLLLLTTALNAQHTPPASSTHIEGTWLFNVTPDDNTPPPFMSLMTFSAGGGLVETETDEQITGQGTWSQGGKDAISITLTQFEFAPSGDPTKPPVWDGTYIAKGSLKYDHAKHQLSGAFTVSFYDTNGNLVFTGTGTMLGNRLNAD